MHLLLLCHSSKENHINLHKNMLATAIQQTEVDYIPIFPMAGGDTFSRAPSAHHSFLFAEENCVFPPPPPPTPPRALTLPHLFLVPAGWMLFFFLIWWKIAFISSQIPFLNSKDFREQRFSQHPVRVPVAGLLPKQMQHPFEKDWK